MQIYQYNISTALEAILNLSHGGMHTYELLNYEKKKHNAETNLYIQKELLNPW